MKPVKIVLFSATGGGLEDASQAAHVIEEQIPGSLQVTARTNMDLFDTKMLERFIKNHVLDADLMVMIFHGGRASCTYFDELIEAGKQTWLYLHPGDEEDFALSRKLSTDFGNEPYQAMIEYIKYGGETNWSNLYRMVLAQIRDEEIQYDPPKVVPTEALYHPDTGMAVTLKDHLAARGLTPVELLNTEKPVIGLTFYSSGTNQKMVDQIIREIEKQGGFPLAAYYMRLPDFYLKNKVTDWIVENYFQYQGKTLLHALINTMGFSMRLSTPQAADAFINLNVPVLHSMSIFVTYQFWRETEQGVTPMDVSMNAAQPEFDGLLISVPSATYEPQDPDLRTEAVLYQHQPIEERIEKAVRLARNWAALSLKPNVEKKIAVVFHNYPPRNDNIGTARGLDSFTSVNLLLERMQQAGYLVDGIFEDGDGMAEAILERVTNNHRWMSMERMADRAVARIGPDEYQSWNEQLPKKNRDHIRKTWGEVPGEVFVHGDQMLVNGIINGNVYLGIQPPRGFLEDVNNIHDPYLAPTHQYLAHYRWIRDVFQADAVLHIGKHGSLEWLPGKSLALSEECYPDLAIQDLPNIYPYIINDPGEGTQAKRRSYACVVDHLIPVMTNADKYEELEEVDGKLLEYMTIKDMNPKQIPVLTEAVWELAEKYNLHSDLEITRDSALNNFDAFVHRLHSYISEVSDTAISDGLHTMGVPPRDQALVEFAAQLVRLKNGNIPSLRESIAHHWGYDYDQLLENRGESDPTDRFSTLALALEAIHQKSLEVVEEIVSGNIPEIAGQNSAVARVVEYLEGTVLPKLEQTTEEIDSVLAALEGGHVAPGASGAPTRGAVDILPTGRNFYSVDPLKIPTAAAWITGEAMGDALVEKYRSETGEPPDNIGMVIWADPTMRTMGEDIAEALYLMGVKPVWNARSGRVEGLEVIPSSELDFPRVDVTFRTSGLFRDTFPNLIELFDEAVMMVANLNEPVETNFIRRNVITEVETLIKRGVDPDEALRDATFRVFSDPPGAYGTGVPEIIDAKAWDENDEIGDIFIEWGGYAYGQDTYGLKKHDVFKRRLTDIRMVVKNEDSREYDMLSCDDFNAYHGGFIVAVKTLTGQYPLGYAGDASDPDRLKVRDIQQEAKHVFRSRILNPKWIEGLMRHGYKGAGDLSRTVDVAFHWDSTTEVVEDWMYEGLAERYALNQAMQEWLRDVNPYALQNITERLLEAINRDMWDADDEMKEELQRLYFEMEGNIEELLD